MVTSNEFKRRLILGELARRGLQYERSGNIWRVFGPGVDLLVTDLAHVDMRSIKFARWHECGETL